MTEAPAGRHLLRIVLVSVLLAASSARADILGAVNSVRSQGCPAHAKSSPPLRGNTRLDEVARYVATGLPLREAEQRAGYHAVSSFSVSVSGVPPSGDVSHIIASQFCAQATNPAFAELGAWRHGEQVWIALAEPFVPPQGSDRAAISARVLALVNAARAHARRCGTQPFAAAPPLTHNAVLEKAALAYAQDMARHGYMDHTGRDGSTPQQRVSRAGYAWLETGENLASGVMDAGDVVAGWLHSPGHCENLMWPAYTEMGVAFAVNPHDEAGVYWALEFGRPARR
jgi:uncharacterized protein YkwD